MILIYTFAYDIHYIKQIIEFFKSRKIDNYIIPVLAKEVRFINGNVIKPYGIDDLLKKTIEKCENRRKNIKHY